MVVYVRQKAGRKKAVRKKTNRSKRGGAFKLHGKSVYGDRLYRPKKQVKFTKP